MQRSALCRSRRELSNAYLLAKFGIDTAENEPFQVCPLSAYRYPKLRENIVAFLSTSRFPRHVIFILIVLGSRISSSHFHLFFFVPSLCIVCRDVNRCALLVIRPSWKHFGAVCFPFETQSGSFCEFSFGADIIYVVEFSLPVTVGLSFLSTPPSSGFDDPRISR